MKEFGPGKGECSNVPAYDAPLLLNSSLPPITCSSQKYARFTSTTFAFPKEEEPVQMHDRSIGDPICSSPNAFCRRRLLPSFPFLCMLAAARKKHCWCLFWFWFFSPTRTASRWPRQWRSAGRDWCSSPSGTDSGASGRVRRACWRGSRASGNQGQTRTRPEWRARCPSCWAGA